MNANTTTSATSTVSYKLISAYGNAAAYVCWIAMALVVPGFFLVLFNYDNAIALDVIRPWFAGLAGVWVFSVASMAVCWKLLKAKEAI